MSQGNEIFLYAGMNVPMEAAEAPPQTKEKVVTASLLTAVVLTWEAGCALLRATFLSSSLGAFLLWYATAMQEQLGQGWSLTVLACGIFMFLPWLARVVIFTVAFWDCGGNRPCSCREQSDMRTSIADCTEPLQPLAAVVWIFIVLFMGCFL